MARANLEGSGTGVTAKLVRVLLPTSPTGGKSVTVIASKSPRSSAGFVGRASLSKIGREEKSLKSAWKDTSPPARGGKEAGAWTLMSMAWTLVKVTRTSLDAPKLAGAPIVTS